MKRGSNLKTFVSPLVSDSSLSLLNGFTLHLKYLVGLDKPPSSPKHFASEDQRGNEGQERPRSYMLVHGGKQESEQSKSQVGKQKEDGAPRSHYSLRDVSPGNPEEQPLRRNDKARVHGEVRNDGCHCYTKGNRPMTDAPAKRRIYGSRHDHTQSNLSAVEECPTKVDLSANFPGV